MREFKRALAMGLAGTMLLAQPGFAPSAFADVKAGVDAWSRGDYGAAVAEWQGPAKAGDPDAEFNLAQAYRLGRGVKPDIGKALALYARAAQKGHLKAADNYALLLFQQGQRKQAMPLIIAASDRGDPRAQYVVGLAHFNGDLIAKDWVRAYALMTLAQSAGLPQASDALRQMDGYIPLSERQMAQSLAGEIKAKSDARRAAQLSAIDLGSKPAGQSRTQARAAPAQAKPPRRIASRDTVQVHKASPSAASAPPTRAATRAASKGVWKLQLGVFSVDGNAERLWRRVQGMAALRGTHRLLVKSGRLTKLLAGGFASRASASAACRTLKSHGQDCLVTRK